MRPTWAARAALVLVATVLTMAASLPSAAEAGLLDRKKKGETHELKDFNFDEGIKEGRWLVMFHAPWCGHCKRFGPVLSDAAENYFGDEIKVAKVDATLQKKLKSRFEINSYPRVMYFEDGEKVAEYRSGRSLDALLAFGERMLADPLRHFEKPEDLLAWFSQPSTERDPAKDPVSFVVLGKTVSPEAKSVQTVAEAAKALRPSALFAECLGEACWAHFCKGSSPPSFCEGADAGDAPVLLRFEANEVPVWFQGDMLDVEAVKTWASTQNVPVFTELGTHNFQSLSAQPGRMLVLGAVNPDDRKNTTQFLSKLRAMARGQASSFPEDALSRVVMAHIDGKAWTAFLEDYGIFLDDLPRIVIIDTEGDAFYEDLEEEAKGVEQFVVRALDGEISPQSSGIVLSSKRLWRSFLRSLPMSGVILALVLLVVIMFFVVLCASEFELEDDAITDPDETTAAGVAEPRDTKKTQ
ncbi:Protein disulfide-isomerase [Hondaea fermentalgiana]|uniref:Protein disulfide-isomerase n=1 Tax=Hondaea fermentalgiana TaxID=2315210 RepID=A0A2R5GZE2_9STRA|nr:Protein disulfide-isomerase [Hondaea fermentalgiana]|eukprot:GBG34133.1 Protein disulfide-isomerase [Hondaea fermentalgiana]